MQPPWHSLNCVTTRMFLGSQLDYKHSGQGLPTKIKSTQNIRDGGGMPGKLVHF